MQFRDVSWRGHDVSEAETMVCHLAGKEARTLIARARTIAAEEAQTKAYPRTYLERLRAEIDRLKSGGTTTAGTHS